ncbi:O-acetyl-ADP-ribose deacetylase [Mixta tenebrionis]|uniref:O-acetyl-ADP-ribose deacetylase n=1 Tax=Mixta tenebrionis TaxID=2562439 RepID=A0A506VGE7_9GAMM|nr:MULTISPECIES: O-acetyl-ADP-ribose deacetylase [Mixta]QHM75953.1 O-acetyl-ADP-ribose deacetylase [Mixta theicola]TPW44476.1 O-acetyl-ADP-ribose deacetylase [Mixta tenebrionis]
MQQRLRIMHGDITRLQVDAIVNAANSSLLGGGGVDGAIHRAAGPALLAECRRLAASQGGCATGEAVVTGAGNLPARAVIHTVGPVWRGGEQGEAELLASAWRNSLRLAAEHRFATVAFPAISTGIYGYPKAEAAAIALRTIAAFFQQHDYPQQVWLVCFDQQMYRLYQQQSELSDNTLGKQDE